MNTSHLHYPLKCKEFSCTTVFLPAAVVIFWCLLQWQPFVVTVGLSTFTAIPFGIHVGNLYNFSHFCCIHLFFLWFSDHRRVCTSKAKYGTVCSTGTVCACSMLKWIGSVQYSFLKREWLRTSAFLVRVHLCLCYWGDLEHAHYYIILKYPLQTTWPRSTFWSKHGVGLTSLVKMKWRSSCVCRPYFLSTSFLWPSTSWQLMCIFLRLLCPEVSKRDGQRKMTVCWKNNCSISWCQLCPLQLLPIQNGLCSCLN